MTAAVDRHAEVGLRARDIRRPVTPATAAGLHAPAPPVGFVDVTAFAPSTATHSEADGHETELR